MAFVSDPYVCPGVPVNTLFRFAKTSIVFVPEFERVKFAFPTIFPLKITLIDGLPV